MLTLPETGYVRISTILGQKAVTEPEANENRRIGKHPRRARHAIPALIPICRSQWWAGVKSGRYPQPVRSLGRRITAWRVEDIRELIKAIAGEDAA